MNGLQGASAIQTTAPKISLLLFTQHNVDSALEYEARKAGFSGAATKGMLNSLIGAIDALIRRESFFLKTTAATPVSNFRRKQAAVIDGTAEKSLQTSDKIVILRVVRRVCSTERPLFCRLSL